MLKLTLFLILLSLPGYAIGEQDAMLEVIQSELDRSMANLSDASEIPLYYLQYSVTELHSLNLRIIDGGFENPEVVNQRYLDVDIRVGSPELDNTHEIRGGSWRDNYTRRRIVSFPIEFDPAAMRLALWNETEYQYSKALERFTKVMTNRQVKVEEEDLSHDFSPVEPVRYVEQLVRSELDTAYWFEVLVQVGDYLSSHQFVHQSSIRLHIDDTFTYMVNSEGSLLQHHNNEIRLGMRVSGMADDGMELQRTEYYLGSTVDKLPGKEVIMHDAERIVGELEVMLSAPVVEPYIGPAILRNRASGVVFHEIFGHRIEGHRQKSTQEGQTFTKKVNEKILPEFISVYDDPTMRQFDGVDLRGFYRYDDEGVAGQRVTVVEKGVLKNFLTSRSPIENFPVSNGHGRRQYGYDVVSRQGNLIVVSEKTVAEEKLRQMLIEECRKQGKPYGLVFEDISGGFTMTRRSGPQAFKVKPLLVVRVYADGRPDEIVRGVDIVGTPLTSFSKIVMTGDDIAVFNGSCGAESGMVPVSAVSPSILVSEIEVEKQRKGQAKPPILPPPGSAE